MDAERNIIYVQKREREISPVKSFKKFVFLFVNYRLKFNVIHVFVLFSNKLNKLISAVKNL